MKENLIEQSFNKWRDLSFRGAQAGSKSGGAETFQQRGK
ncbi:unnamed protein product [Larinioides sclopetarius]|uniref:Uncharacterized protein n=1 Tax=Larinioides sclopetarius TaxID=280406 RepID=A0AAV2AXS5_9ARAC